MNPQKIESKVDFIEEIIPVPVNDNVIDSLSMLTGLSIGDIKSSINDGNFEELALSALSSFKDKYYDIVLGNNANNKLDETEVLMTVLDEVNNELLTCNEESRNTLLKEKESLELMIKRVH